MAQRINYAQWTVGKTTIRAQAGKPAVYIEAVERNLPPEVALELAHAIIEAAHLAKGSPAGVAAVTGANVADLAQLVRARPPSDDSGPVAATPAQKAAVAVLGQAVAAEAPNQPATT